MQRTSLVAVTCVLALALGAGAAPALPHPAAPASFAAPPYAAARSTPVEDPYYPAHGDPGVDTLHYGLDLRWAPRTRVLSGTAKIALRVTRATSSVQLDLGAPLRVLRVTLDGRRARFTHPGNVVRVHRKGLHADSRHRLVITYRGTPRPVHAPTTRSDFERLGWTIRPNGTVWTMQEPFGAFTWYPVNDQPSDKAYYDFRIDVPARWVGIANGRMVNRHTVKGRTVTRWHLASPAASYLTTIAIGDYRRFADTGPHGLPLTYWLPKGSPASWLRILRRMPHMLRWLEAELGPYPFDRAGAVVVPSRSAMETQTLVTMGSGAFTRSDRVAVVLHELAHQWYGDTVTPTTWKDLWLNEAFAMYIQARWESEHGGTRMARWVDYWTSNDQAYRDSDGPPGAWRRDRFGETCVYYCGALVLHKLRHRIGPETFNRALRAWPQRHRSGNASRASYIRWLGRFSHRHVGPWLNHVLDARNSPFD